ncbi:MAG: VanW family protein [Paraprevotella sp.]|nr:VanW family protein [Paraprevotella sp.]
MARKKLFCELCPAAYAISLQKEIWKRHIANLLNREKFSDTRRTDKLPVVVAARSNNMIKRGPGIDLQLQLNKADNIRLACGRLDGRVIGPGESFSFWKYVGRTSRANGFKEGRVIVNGRLVAGMGGGLCNLANTIHQLVMYSPLTITELHHHSDALAPDPDGRRIPYSAGTSVNYNFIDFRFRNDTDRPVQLCTWCEGDNLYAELRTTEEYPYTYNIIEEDHHFHKEDNGEFYRMSAIYRETYCRKTGNLIRRELKRANRSKVMFDYSLIPVELIR